LRTRGPVRRRTYIPRIEIFPAKKNDQVIIVIRLKGLETLSAELALELVKLCESTIKVLLNKEGEVSMNFVNEKILSDAELRTIVDSPRNNPIKNINAIITAIYADLVHQLSNSGLGPVELIIWKYKKIRIPSINGYETIIIPTIMERWTYRPIDPPVIHFIPFRFFD